ERARDGDPVRDREEARQVRDRNQPALLEIDLVPAERASETERWLEVGRWTSKQAKEVRMVPRIPQDRHERRHDLQAAASLPEVEGNICADQVRRVWIL